MSRNEYRGVREDRREVSTLVSGLVLFTFIAVAIICAGLFTGDI